MKKKNKSKSKSKKEGSSSESSYSPKRAKNSSMSVVLPKDVQVDLDKEQIYRIGKDIGKSAIRAMELGYLKKTKTGIISQKIQKKIDELQYKVRTVDGGSCMGKIEEK